MSIREKIGSELRALRIERKLTTHELGELTGLAHSHIVRIEGGRYNIRLDMLNLLTEALGATITIQKNNE